MALENMITVASLEDSSRPKYLAIADEIGQLILGGQLPTGERLPPQRKLAQRLKVTAGTVSHAYMVLEQRGMATARVGDGTYVRTPEAADVTLPGTAAVVTPVDLAHNVAIPTLEDQALPEVLRAIAADPDSVMHAMTYQPEAGLAHHREAGAQWLQRFGTAGDASRVMVTHGAQHGLSCVLRALARPGDVVLTEHLSYPGLQALARLMRLQLVGLETDEQGLLPDALDQAARNMGARILFCSPSLHNPTNATMSLQRRRQVTAVAEKHHLMLIEDTVQAAIQSAPLPALSTLRPEHSILLASFSKVLGPGLRVGYIEAAPQWLSKFAASMRADCWMVAPLMPEIASRWLQDGTVETLIAAQRARIAERLAVAHRHLKGADYWSDPQSALVWLPLPDAWRAGQFAAALRLVGVQVRTADHFAVGRSAAPHAVRISLNAAQSLEQLERGLATLVQTMHGAPLARMDP